MNSVLGYILLFKITMGLPRSPEAKKRKAPANKVGATNGPSAKKAKTSKESSSSEESSSEDEEAVAKPTKAAPAGGFNIFDTELIRLADSCQQCAILQPFTHYQISFFYNVCFSSQGGAC